MTVAISGTATGTAFENANSFFVDASNGLTAYTDDTVVAADVFTDAGFRALIKRMDDNDVNDRSFIHHTAYIAFSNHGYRAICVC